MRRYRRTGLPLAGRSTASRGKQQILLAILFPVLLIVAALQWQWITENRSTLFRTRAAWYVQRMPCDWCGQTGFVLSNTGTAARTMCPVCLGRGGAYIRRLDTNDVICPACGGMGRILDFNETTAHYCERCGGRGLIRADELAPGEAAPAAPED